MKTLLSLLLLLLFFNSSYAANKYDIEILKFKFTPAEITIHAGDSIRWTNKEKRQYHSVWFEQLGEPEPDYFFPGEFYERTFKETGDFPYRCGPHPKMTGTVHVLPDGDQSDQSNKAQSDKGDSAATYMVKSIEDGDTMVFEINGEPQRVQLIGIDAPENTENAKLKLDSSSKKIKKADLLEIGKLSTEYLKKLAKPEKKLILTGDLTQKDKYNRVPAIVMDNNGKSLNQQMIEDGYAILLTRFPLDEVLKNSLEKAQKKAQSDKTGLWKSHPDLMQKWSSK